MLSNMGLCCCSPHFGIAHALCLGLAPWLAAEIPYMIGAVEDMHVQYVLTNEHALPFLCHRLTGRASTYHTIHHRFHGQSLTFHSAVVRCWLGCWLSFFLWNGCSCGQTASSHLPSLADLHIPSRFGAAPSKLTSKMVIRSRHQSLHSPGVFELL